MVPGGSLSLSLALLVGWVAVAAQALFASLTGDHHQQRRTRHSNVEVVVAPAPARHTRQSAFRPFQTNPIRLESGQNARLDIPLCGMRPSESKSLPSARSSRLRMRSSAKSSPGPPSSECRDEVLIVPVHQIASIVAEGELLHLRTAAGVLHTINDRLKEVEAGLDPAEFIRLGRGTFANVDLITRLAMMPGAGHVAVLTTEQS
jgi:hypothetical protein